MNVDVITRVELDTGGDRTSSISIEECTAVRGFSAFDRLVEIDDFETIFAGQVRRDE